MYQQTNSNLLPAPYDKTRLIAEWDHRYDTATESIGDWLRTLFKPAFGTCTVMSATHHYVGVELYSFDSSFGGFCVSFFKKTNARKKAQYFPEDADFRVEAAVDRQSGKVLDVTLWAQASRPKLAKWVEQAAMIHKLSAA